MQCLRGGDNEYISLKGQQSGHMLKHTPKITNNKREQVSLLSQKALPVIFMQERHYLWYCFVNSPRFHNEHKLLFPHETVRESCRKTAHRADMTLASV